jgi:hypothetical protein
MNKELLMELRDEINNLYSIEYRLNEIFSLIKEVSDNKEVHWRFETYKEDMPLEKKAEILAGALREIIDKNNEYYICRERERLEEERGDLLKREEELFQAISEFNQHKERSFKEFKKEILTTK